MQLKSYLSILITLTPLTQLSIEGRKKSSIKKRKGKAVRGKRAVVASSILFLLAGCAKGVQTPPKPSDEPTATPTSSAAVTETPKPTKTQKPQGPKEISQVTISELLPKAKPLVEGMLSKTNQNWALLSVTGYSDSYSNVENPDDIKTLGETYLLDPDGALYQLPPLEGGSSILQWLPGTRDALTYTYDEHNGAHIYLQDLETGRWMRELDFGAMDPNMKNLDSVGVEITFVGDGSTDLLMGLSSSNGISTLERVSLGGEIKAKTDTDWLALKVSPDGTRIAKLSMEGKAVGTMNAKDLKKGKDIPKGQADCYFSEWVDSSSWISSCPVTDANGSEKYSWTLNYENGNAITVDTGMYGWVSAIGDPQDPIFYVHNPQADIAYKAYKLQNGKLVDFEMPLKEPIFEVGTQLLGGTTEMTGDGNYYGIQDPAFLWNPTNGRMLKVIDELAGKALTITSAIPSKPDAALGGISLEKGQLEIYMD